MELADILSIWLEIPLGPEAVLGGREVSRWWTSSLEQLIESRLGTLRTGVLCMKTGGLEVDVETKKKKKNSASHTYSELTRL